MTDEINFEQYIATHGLIINAGGNNYNMTSDYYVDKLLYCYYNVFR